ncbi:molybdate ABC transporter ATP-binding protein ModF [Thorsellia kenyensis]|uniref:Molybdate ABC transporter ATP-binding protein ModF n=1 Tax=Thorsellia kenyensis TaxID=1549888 RepID=A0ABV6C7Y6_9GAMM
MRAVAVFLSLSEVVFRLNYNRFFTINSARIERNDFLVIVGQNGSGKSAIGAALAGYLDILSGDVNNSFESIELVSFEYLQRILNKEWARDNTDNLLEDEIGKTAQEFILEDQKQKINDKKFKDLICLFNIEYLLKRPFKLLSTGEMRKVFLCQKLLKSPDLLILDEPFDGLDAESTQYLKNALTQLHNKGTTIVLILNRFNDIPSCALKLGIVSQLELIEIGPKAALMGKIEIEQLASLENLSANKLPPPPISAIRYDHEHPKVILKNGHISYGDSIIFDNFNWQVSNGQHWQITGENGSGKSTLLSLITGDHPQGYANDLTLFGIKRGSGETIWDIKKHIGYVSSSFHQSYRVKTTVENVVISGYFDSIGLYETPSEEIKSLTNQWFEFLNWPESIKKAPFHSLSWGQQRLILIVRAFVKHPALLILDEPFQGLDALNREWVKIWISKLIELSSTQLLFVSHHIEDAPSIITHRLRLFKGKTPVLEQI